ncbi:hypothetical protein IFR04_005878 [Cadophora malorum]|uniref:Mid2 domain-containing protein n=1 Tax=Cadophora malorum TaxID=108018 RepID=A0A8H7TG80_9HELO|nr:hypothetical protein IFR04_005878 [Cadophora malorum]
MSPNPRFGIRKRNRESKDTHVDTLTRSPGDGSISPTSSSTSTEPRKTAENNHCLELRSGTSPVTEAQDTEPENGIEERQDSRYVTLTITGSSGTYVTLVELGDTTIATSYPVSQTTARSRIPNPGIPTGTIVGIVVGISLGVLALVGVFYVYLLRARHLKQIRRRRRRARRKSSGSGGPGPAPAPPPPAEGGGPFPPANP